MLMANDSSEFWKSDDDVVVGGNAVVEGFEGSNDFFFDIDSLSRDLLEDSDQWDDTLLNSPEDLSCNNSFQAGVVPSEVERRSQLELQNCMHESEDVPPREDELLEPSQWCLIDSRAGMGSEQMFGFPETSGMAFDNGKVDPVSHIESPLRTCSVSLTDWSTMSGVEHDTCSSREGDGGAMYAPLYNYDISMMPSEAPSCSTTFNFASGDSSGSTDHVKNEKEIDFMHAGDSHSKCASHLTEMEESDSGYGSHSAAFGNSMEDPRVLEMNFHMSTAEIDFIDVETSLPNPHSIECNGNLVADMRCGDRKIYAEQSSCERSSITAGSSIYKDTHQFLPHFLDLPFMGNREENVICTEVEKKDQLLFSQNIFMNNTVNLEAEEAISVTPTVSAMGFSYTSTYQGTSPKCETSSHCSPTGRESSSDADGCSSSVASWKPMHGSQLFMPRKKEMVCTVDDQRDDLHTSNYSSVRSSAYATDDGPCAALNQLVPDAQSRLSSKRLEVSVKDERKEEINLRRNMSSHHVKANGVVKGNNSVYSHNVDEADVCILEDISHPRNVPPVRHGESLITSQRPVLDPLYHMGMGGTRLKANDETITLRVALQDLSQPKSESSPPDGSLAVPLLRHQRIALSWMVQKEKSSLQCSGGILADDQGLGKTISTIALILTEKPPSAKVAATSVKQNEPKSFNLDDDEDDGGVLHLNGMKQDIHSGQDMMNKSSVKNENAFMLAKGRPAAGTLIVCPTSVLRQWADELRNKVSTNLSILVYHGSNRTKDHFDLAKYDVVLTTYSIVSMEVPKQPLVDKDDDEKGQAEGHGLPPMEFSSSKKRKYPPSGDKKSRKNKKGVDGALLESTARPLARVGWFRVVLDEAQSIKNHRTQVARACWGLRAKRRWCLSGTPIQNAIDDLYSYFRFLRYDPYAAYKSFCSMIKVPISRNPVTGYKKLQAVLKTIMLRRTKGSLLDGEPIINLPPKSIELKRVEFSMEERDFYSKLEADSRAQFKVYAAAGTVKQNYVNILLMLLRLRQACDHPLLVKGYDSSSVWRSSLETAKKLSREKQIQLLNCLEACSDICGICNDPPEDAVVTICGHIFCNQCILEYLTGDENLCPAAQCKVHLNITSVFSRETLRSTLFDQPNHENSATQPVESLEPCSQGPSGSSKIMAALEVLESLSKPCDSSKDGSLKNNEVTKSSGRITEFHSQDKAHLTTESCLNDSSVKVSEKAIVFSQWTRMLDLLEAHLKHSSIQYRRLDGTMSVLARDKAVKDFNTIPEVTVMIMSLKAASLGLNMVAACHVILLDLWWNPTTEDQAIDRAHRIGQTRPVTVLRLTVKDTVEDRILALQQKKREMVSSAFGEDETGSRQTRLTVDDLKYLFMA